MTIDYNQLLPILTLVVGYFIHFLETQYTDKKRYEREKREKRNERLLEFLMKLNRYIHEVISGFSKIHSQRADRDYVAKVKERIDVVSGQYMSAKAITELYGNNILNTSIEELNDAMMKTVDEFLEKENKNTMPSQFGDLDSSKEFFNKKRRVLEELHKAMGIKFES